jgi:hypothetical protein
MSRYQAFLSDLAALTRKHRMVVVGCGCCGSPFLLETDDSGPRITPAGVYTVQDDGKGLEWSELWTVAK